MQDKKFDIVFAPQNGIIWIFIILAGLILPILLIPLVKIIGYTEIVEETAKALVILFLILKLPNNKIRILIGIIFGFLFGLSESVFYLNNIFQVGNLDIFWQRFLWTIPMHIITILVMMFVSLWRKWFLIFGLASAVVLHLLFNNLIIGF
jgi:hypothetical protein